MKKTTPLMQQYYAIKAEYPDALLFFQVGDFFELFFDDAKKAASFLGIALTKRGKDKGADIPLCGVPVHSVQHHVHKLIKGGFCVVMCEQLEPAQPGVVVKRGVTKVLTPGMLTDEYLLDEKSASYILSFVQLHNKWTLLFGELLTAQLYATTFDSNVYKSLETELARFFPDEVIVAQDEAASLITHFKKQGYFTQTITPSSCKDTTAWTHKQLHDSLHEVIASNASLEKALSVLHAYLQKNNASALQEFSHIHMYAPEDFMMLDGATQKNLELVKNLQNGSSKNTLCATLDQTVTPMGARTLKKWLVRPLVHKKAIEHRQEAVAWYVRSLPARESLQTVIKNMGDFERIVGRIGLSRASLQDYKQLMYVLELLPSFVQQLQSAQSALLHILQSYCVDLQDLYNYLQSALHQDATYQWTIKAGFNAELDHYRSLVLDSQKALLALEKKEQAATGINSLKVRYTSVHGYYIEVTHANRHLVPDYYIRRQTLVGKERFTCPELQTLQHDIMHAQSAMQQLEHTLFEQVKAYVYPYVGRLRKIAYVVGQVDVLLSFATCAYQRGYTQPVITETYDICIKQGKHPVIEQTLQGAFIANDTHLYDEQSLIVLTGPNMGGKSTYLRQIAQLCIMAQCGSFVPAQEAFLPLLDRIFTRIGASDNVAEGKSTFLVEMEETAHICQYATQKSLVILDEVGRGTSTFDGLALAQAVVEYLYTHIKARCLFATHYHELTHLSDQYTGIANFYAVSKKTDDGILFLHTIAPGVAHSSFGLEVAALAHIPHVVIARARTILQELLQTAVVPAKKEQLSDQVCTDALQKKIAFLEKKIAYLEALNVDELSPKQALDVLWNFKQRSTQ